MNQIINPQTIKDGFTQSEIETLDTCPYKWWLKYDQKLDSPHCDWNLLIGSAWHTFQEQLWKGEKVKPIELQICKEYLPLSSEDQAYKEQVERIFQVYADCYLELMKDDIEGGWKIDNVEDIADFTIEFEGVNIRFKGKLDLLGEVLGKRSVVDHKTMTNWNSSKGWETRFQFMFYLWMQREIQPDKPAKQLVVNAIRKPSIRQKKDESFQGYLNRLRLEILKDEENYFQKTPLPLLKGSMDKFKQDVLTSKFRKLSMISNPETPTPLLEVLALERRTKNCIDSITGKECEFLGICHRGYTPENYIKRNHKHTELSE